MLSPKTTEIPRALAATERDTFIGFERGSTPKARLSSEYNYGLSSKGGDSNFKFTLNARNEGRLYADDSRLNATVFEDHTSTELFIDGGGEHTSIMPPEAVVLFIHAALEEMGRRPHEVNVSAIRHNLTEAQMSALAGVGFAGFNMIPPEEIAQVPQPDLHPTVAHV